MINFYRRFIPKCADIAKPLTDLLRGRAKSLTMTPQAIQAFEQLKSTLSTEALLVRRKVDAPLAVMTDASNVAVGAVLQQHVDQQWQPLAFFSKKLNATQTKYSTFGRELLAVYLAIKHFRYMLEGNSFTIYTDHKPLTKSLMHNHDKYSPREIRQLEFISQFAADIRYIKGNANEAADALSRLSINTFSIPDINYQDIANIQKLTAVSINRVKPPFLKYTEKNTTIKRSKPASEQAPYRLTATNITSLRSTPTTETTTRSGRRVHWPDRYVATTIFI
ncbi:unnamed protein product [Schistosoma spindalis]|nr:unnamed protein product [Schistosoma spindale]